MELLAAIITATTLFTSSLIAGASATALSSAPTTMNTVEIGMFETSPRGEEGGLAMPASGCSAADPRWHGTPIHDCDILPDISTDKPIIRLGDSITVHWDPKVHTNCTLSKNITDIPPLPVDANSVGSRVDTPTGQTNYTIECAGGENTDTATIKVLPRIQET